MPAPDVQTLLRELIRSPDNHCFVCSLSNPVGLHLHFTESEGVIRTQFVPGEWHEGWAGVVHGGILAAALDEAMAYTLFFQGVKAVTAKMAVRYRAPVHRGDILNIEARIVRDTRRLAEVDGRVVRDGGLVAEATGHFIKLGDLDAASLG